MGSQDAETEVKVNQPWWNEYSQQNALQQANRLYNYRRKNPLFYEGERLAGFDPYQTQAFDRTRQIAEGGSVLPDALQQYQATVGGEYLGQNPYLDAAVDRGLRRIQGTVGRTFAGSNALGSGAFARALADQTAGYATQAYARNYENERDRQLAALSQAPSMAAVQYADPRELERVGALRQAQTQAELSNEMAKYYELERAQNEGPLNQYLQQILPVMAATPVGQTQTQSAETDWISAGLGLGSLGAGLLGTPMLAAGAPTLLGRIFGQGGSTA